MKKHIILILIITMLYNCGYIEIKNKNIIKNKFDNQKSINLTQATFSFYPVFYVNDSYKISKKISIYDYLFKIKDLKNNKLYFVNGTTEDNNTIFFIKEKEQKLCEIKNILKEDYLLCEFIYNDKKYFLTGQKHIINENSVLSINYKITDTDNKEIGYIFKEFYYMKNSYDIIINQDLNNFEDIIYIGLTLFIDTILKENGFFYRK